MQKGMRRPQHLTGGEETVPFTKDGGPSIESVPINSEGKSPFRRRKGGQRPFCDVENCLAKGRNLFKKERLFSLLNKREEGRKKKKKKKHAGR